MLVSGFLHPLPDPRPPALFLGSTKEGVCFFLGTPKEGVTLSLGSSANSGL